ncbi:hypothetical protein J4229_02365 [Candidatus Pacearchaeota archaeon]|nr:hypothetical protein [Candidatus Pacearchaeota archaeon]
MELIAFLGNDKENWGQVNALINRGEWEKVILVKNKNSDGFSSSKECESVSVNSERTLVELKKDIMEKLNGKLGELEVALSLASGSGKEHMALISALLSMPVGIRLVVFTKEGLEFVN